MKKEIFIEDNFITLTQFLKLNGDISSGGEARYFIIENECFLNGVKVIEKRKKIYKNDYLKINDQEYVFK